MATQLNSTTTSLSRLYAQYNPDMRAALSNLSIVSGSRNTNISASSSIRRTELYYRLTRVSTRCSHRHRCQLCRYGGLPLLSSCLAMLRRFVLALNGVAHNPGHHMTGLVWMLIASSPLAVLRAQCACIVLVSASRPRRSAAIRPSRHQLVGTRLAFTQMATSNQMTCLVRVREALAVPEDKFAKRNMVSTSFCCNT